MAANECPVCFRNPNPEAMPNEILECSTCHQVLQLLPNGFAALSESSCERLTATQRAELATGRRLDSSGEPTRAVAKREERKASDRELAVLAWCQGRGLSVVHRDGSSAVQFVGLGGSTFTVAVPADEPDAFDYVARIFCVDGSPLDRMAQKL